MSVLEVNDDNFEIEVLQSELPVLVYVSALWCGPCKKQLPIIKELIQEFETKFKFVKVDADMSPQIIKNFNIKNIPTLFLIKNKNIVILTSGLKLSSFIKDKILSLV